MTFAPQFPSQTQEKQKPTATTDILLTIRHIPGTLMEIAVPLLPKSTKFSTGFHNLPQLWPPVPPQATWLVPCPHVSALWRWEEQFCLQVPQNGNIHTSGSSWAAVAVCSPCSLLWTSFPPGHSHNFVVSSLLAYVHTHAHTHTYINVYTPLLCCGIFIGRKSSLSVCCWMKCQNRLTRVEGFFFTYTSLF